MRHRRRVKHFSRKSGPRKALLRGLMVSLVEHGRIKTTVEKAKELRRHIEKAITLGKKNDLATRRLLISKIANGGAVNSIMTDLSPRFKERAGGYTRIIKLGRRPGDTAEMAFIEFVDYSFDSKKKTSTSKEATSADEKQKKSKPTSEQAKEAKKTTRLIAAKKKSVKKIQKKSRQSARA